MPYTSLAGKHSTKSGSKKNREKRTGKITNYLTRNKERKKYIKIIIRTHASIPVKDPFVRINGHVVHSKDDSMLTFNSDIPYIWNNEKDGWVIFTEKIDFKMKNISEYVDTINLNKFRNIENVITFNSSEVGNLCYGIGKFDLIVQTLKERFKGMNLSVVLLNEVFKNDHNLRRFGFPDNVYKGTINFISNIFNRSSNYLILDKRYTRAGNLAEHAGIEILDTNLDPGHIGQINNRFKDFLTVKKNFRVLVILQELIF